MRERLSEFQGRLDIDSEENQGTLLRVEMPLSQSDLEGADASGPPDLERKLHSRMVRAERGEDASATSKRRIYIPGLAWRRIEL